MPSHPSTYAYPNVVWQCPEAELFKYLQWYYHKELTKFLAPCSKIIPGVRALCASASLCKPCWANKPLNPVSRIIA